MKAKSRKSAGDAGGNASTHEIAGVTLTHPDKVLYSGQGVTKREVAEYYEQVERWMLPGILHRPLALVRCPGGQSTKCFFQAQLVEHAARRRRQSECQ